MVAIAELELDDIADGGGYRVGHKGILWSTNDDGDNLVGGGNYLLLALNHIAGDVMAE